MSSIGGNNEIHLLNLQSASALKQNHNSSITKRIGSYLSTLLNYQMSTFNYVHVLSCYLLPAMPRPKSTIFASKGKSILYL